jgi:hypothetical protein
MGYAGLVIFLILLWIRPEYRFLLFYVVANTILVLVLTVWSLAPQDVPIYAIGLAINDVILLALGAVVVALRKWLKTQKSGEERRAEALVAEARAEAAGKRD